MAKCPKGCVNYQSILKQTLPVYIPHIVHKNEGIQQLFMSMPILPSKGKGGRTHRTGPWSPALPQC